MTNEELKLEAIKKAYGEYWDLVGDYVDVNGYLQSNDIAHHNWKGLFSLPLDFYAFYEGSLVRPKSLSGIENNNSWIKIEEDGSNLPTDEGCYFVHSKVRWKPFYRIDIFTGRLTNSIENGKSIFTHYQPIVKPKPPVY